MDGCLVCLQQNYWQSTIEEFGSTWCPSMAYHFSNHSFSPPHFRDEAGLSSAEDRYEGWRYKLIDYWSSYDTLFWLLSELYKLKVQNPESLKLENFVNMRGYDLKRFSLEDFRRIIPQYGEVLYHQLQLRLRSAMDDEGRGDMVAHQQNSNPSTSSTSTSVHHHLHPHPRVSYFDQPVYPPLPLPLPHNISPDAVPKLWSPSRQYYDCWAYKCVMEWSPSDTIDCIVHELIQMNINPSNVAVDNFRDVCGRDLVKMTADDFKLMLPMCGELLYRTLKTKLKSNLESKLPWRRTRGDVVVYNQGISQPLSFAHRQELQYAHPSCFRWKSEKSFPGRSTDNDAVLNLSREHILNSASDSYSRSIPSQASPLAGSSPQSLSFDQSFTHSKSHCSVSKSDFSILNLTKDCIKQTSTVVKQEVDSDPPLEIILPDPVKKPCQDSECPPSQSLHLRDSDSRDSFSGDTIVNIQDPADPEHTKEKESFVESSVMDHGYDSETNDETLVGQEDEKPEDKKEKRKPGRPRNLLKKDKAKGKVGRVWEFIRDLIMDPKYNPSVITWEDREKGLFRFRSGDQVAKLWGCKRGNPRMNFENFSRSIRQNYKKGYLLPVEKIRLVYQFGPRSTGWRPGDPPTRPVTLPSATTTVTVAAQ